MNRSTFLRRSIFMRSAKNMRSTLWIRNAGLMSVPGSGYLRSILISVRAAQSVQEIVR